ncbi:phospho-N-acetylmuramoyl-pentapeptide-transferase [Candidatus Dependentiae bacterium]|nr:phospho-N-acetylmuramoyl-pentapeptide-transferase [Candidatus Dependentiae bacterium]
MIYHLARYFQPHYSFLNLFHYISFRAIAALLTSILFSFIFGNWFIRIVSEQDVFRSKPREWTPDNHLTKRDTPTMGGLFVLLVCLFNTLLWNNLQRIDVWLFLFCLLIFGAIGFLDDFSKLRFGRGISAKKKFLLQLAGSLVVMTIWYMVANPNTQLCVPFFKGLTPWLGWFLIPWGIFLLVGTSNAVNLTDGLDGLAAGPLMSNFMTFSIIAYLAGHKFLSQYLQIPFAGTAEIAIIGSTLMGAMLGFLWYNTYPAQVFMGDVGSLALGAGLAFMAIMSRNELLLPLAGGIFVLETVSVVIQVLTVRLWGIRMFRMAPIHHHFELLGWKEAKITVRFWIISIILSLLTLLTLKIR